MHELFLIGIYTEGYTFNFVVLTKIYWGILVFSEKYEM